MLPPEALTTLDLLKQTAADLPAVYKHAAEPGGRWSTQARRSRRARSATSKKPLLYIGGGLLGLYLLRRRA